MNDSDFSAFLKEMEDVKPLAQSDRVQNNTKSKPTLAQLERRKSAQKVEGIEPGLSSEYVELVEYHDVIEFKRDGIQDGVYKKLRLGKYGFDATLHLNHLSVNEARQQLLQFIKECRRLNLRTVLIQHGSGTKEKPGWLRSYVFHWLKQLTEVQAVHSALKAHGGNKASYVLLQKSQEKKLHNREMHQKR